MIKDQTTNKKWVCEEFYTELSGNVTLGGGVWVETRIKWATNPQQALVEESSR